MEVGSGISAKSNVREIVSTITNFDFDDIIDDVMKKDHLEVYELPYFGIRNLETARSHILVEEPFSL